MIVFNANSWKQTRVNADPIQFKSYVMTKEDEIFNSITWDEQRILNLIGFIKDYGRTREILDKYLLASDEAKKYPVEPTQQEENAWDEAMKDFLNSKLKEENKLLLGLFYELFSCPQKNLSVLLGKIFNGYFTLSDVQLKQAVLKSK